jgi:hypothetical protein
MNVLDSDALLLLAPKLAGVVFSGVAAFMQLRSSRDQPLTRYQRSLAVMVICGVLVTFVAEIIGTAQQVKSARESDSREARLLANVQRLTRPLFPIDISTTWNVRMDSHDLQQYARLWTKMMDDRPRSESYTLSARDLPPIASHGREELERIPSLEIRIYGAIRTSQRAFDQPDVLIHAGDGPWHEYGDPRAAIRKAAFLAERSYVYRRGGSVDFVDAPTRVLRGAFTAAW